MFFIITSISVVVLTILVCVALFYLIRILRNVSDMTDRLKRGSEQLAEDAIAIRSFVHNGIIGTIKNTFARFTQGGASSKSSKKKHEDTDA